MSRGRDWSVLRQHDPVPGDPVALARVARECDRTAQALADGVAALLDVGCRSTGWRSPAAEAFRARTGDAVTALQQARPRFEQAAEVLAGYALAVRHAQDDADAVLARARRARDDRDAADRVRRAVDDPAQQRVWAERAEQAQRRLDAADRVLTEVEARWWQAGSRAAASLADVTAADGLDDGWDVLGAVAVVADVAGTVSLVLGSAALVALAVTAAPAVVAGLAAASTLAGLISLAALHELWVHDRVSAGQFATEAAWALAGLLTGGVAHGLRGATAAAGGGLGAGRLAGRLGTTGATVVDGAGHGMGPGRAAWQAGPGRDAPPTAPAPRSASAPSRPPGPPGAGPVGPRAAPPPGPAAPSVPRTRSACSPSASAAGLRERHRGVPSTA